MAMAGVGTGTGTVSAAGTMIVVAEEAEEGDTTWMTQSFARAEEVGLDAQLKPSETTAHDPDASMTCQRQDRGHEEEEEGEELHPKNPVPEDLQTTSSQPPSCAPAPPSPPSVP